MRKYIDYRECNGELIDSGELFCADEKEKADKILGILDGMSIIAAKSLLLKCVNALRQTEFRS